jgi:hypothetical protein
MSTIAKRVRLSKYDGDVGVPTLMELRNDELKEGDRFYLHNKPRYSEEWRWLVPIEIVRVRRGYNGKGGRPLIIWAAWMLPNGVKEYIRYSNMTDFLNPCFLQVPSEQFIVLQMLGLLPEHYAEVVEYLVYDLPGMRREQLKTEVLGLDW